MRKQEEITQNLLMSFGESLHIKNDKQMGWDRHVHVKQELVPPKFNNLFLTSWQTLTSTPGLKTRRKAKIGCSKVNNTLSIKTGELRKVSTNGTKTTFITP